MKYVLIFFYLTMLFSSCKRGNYFQKDPPLPTEVDSLFQVVYNDLPIRQKKVAIQRIEKYLSTRENDSTKRRSYLKVANRYYYLTDFDNFYNKAKIAFSLAQKAEDTLIIARSHYYFGDYYFGYKNIDSAFYHYSKAASYFDITQDFNTQNNVLLKISALYSSIKDYANSEKYAVEAMKIAESHDNSFDKYGAFNQMGNVLRATKDFDRAYSYYEKAIYEMQKAEKMSHYLRSLTDQSYLNMGVIKMKQNDYRSAKNLFDKVDSEELLQITPINYTYLLRNYAYTIYKLGKKNVIPLFLEALKFEEKEGHSNSKISTQLLISKYYLETGKPDSSFFYAKQAYKTADKEKILDNKLEALYLLAKTDVENNSSWYEAYIRLQDSIVDYERKQRDKFALIAYDTENIRTQKTIAEAQRDKARVQSWAIMLISVLFGFGIFMIFKYRLKRLKHRELLINQKEMQANETVYKLMLEEQFKIEHGKHIEKKRISQELHDGVLGKLSGIRLNLFVLNKKQDQETVEKCLLYIKDLQKVEKEIRAISHNLNKDLFSDQVNFTKIVTELFENIADHTAIKLHMYFDELIDWKSIPTTTKIEIYRILQEGLHNIEKHAYANHVIVRMFQDKSKICIELADDGVGMSKPVSSNGIGHKNMSERATKINADLQIDSQKNKGTTLSLSIPK